MTDTFSRKKSEDQVIDLINSVIGPLGYEVVTVELHNVSQSKKLRVFIDFADSSETDRYIGIEDCVRVTRALDEPLDQAPEIDAIFKSAYELEVSSPGVDRPLRRPGDYDRFAGREARIHVFRPLTGDELGNSDYQNRNPKQKNFFGKLEGVREGKVALTVPPVHSSGNGKSKKAGKKQLAGTQTEPGTENGTEVLIPISLITKAHLEPRFEITDGRGDDKAARKV